MPLFHFGGKRPENLGVNEEGKFLVPVNPNPNNVSSQADPTSDAQHYIAPLEYSKNNTEWSTPKDAMQHLKAIVEQNDMSGQTTHVVECTDNYLYVEFTSGFFGFCDDVEFYAPDDDNSNVVHVRSASRLGKSDLGANRKRIETIRSTWKQEQVQQQKQSETTTEKEQ